MSQAIKAIIFDIGGVVLSPRNFEGLRKKIADVLGIGVDEMREFFHEQWVLWRFDKIDEEQFFASLVKRFGKVEDENKSKQKADKMAEKMKKFLHNLAKPNKDVIAIISSLKGRYKIAALTNTSREWFEDNVRKFELKKYFDVIITSYEERIAKPDTRFYELALKKLGLPAESCVFIDNAEKNIPPAQALGMNTILFRGAEDLVNRLKALNIEV
jgi:2-haloacid dehalogenase